MFSFRSEIGPDRSSSVCTFDGFRSSVQSWVGPVDRWIEVEVDFFIFFSQNEVARSCRVTRTDCATLLPTCPTFIRIPRSLDLIPTPSLLQSYSLSLRLSLSWGRKTKTLNFFPISTLQALLSCGHASQTLLCHFYSFNLPPQNPQFLPQFAFSLYLVLNLSSFTSSDDVSCSSACCSSGHHTILRCSSISFVLFF